jgi:hypothetical protein
MMEAGVMRQTLFPYPKAKAWEGFLASDAGISPSAYN